jgi:putative component of toxin-antitoxin plasmid stabilization module
MIKEIRIYRCKNKKKTFIDWLESLQDIKGRSKITNRLNRVVLLGGDKKSQKFDIKRAKEYWAEFRESYYD